MSKAQGYESQHDCRYVMNELNLASEKPRHTAMHTLYTLEMIIIERGKTMRRNTKEKTLELRIPS